MRVVLIVLSVSAGFSNDLRAAQCTGTTQAALNACATDAYAAADNELNAVYSIVKTRLASNAGAQKRLAAAQKAWIAFRDAECRFAISQSDGGSIQPMLLAKCLEDTTRKRSADLRRYLTCAEGDLSCPVPRP